MRDFYVSLTILLSLFLSRQAFDRFVEIGRVVYIKEGVAAKNIAVVLEVIDLNRVLVQGPSVARQPVLIRHTNLTPFKIAVPRAARTKTMMKCWTESGIEAKWAASVVAKKLAQKETRKNLTDFDRFKVMVAQKKKAFILRA